MAAAATNTDVYQRSFTAEVSHCMMSCGSMGDRVSRGRCEVKSSERLERIGLYGVSGGHVGISTRKYWSPTDLGHLVHLVHLTHLIHSPLLIQH
eukprot:GHVN01058758.1.p1 GENE.GHVN01058758.1~~GHVN01058758.1.p1  ORF type:complete len:102 (-),score=23.87 GHVN01058758.1:231-512(-)